MSLIVEDGSGVAGAESYISVAAADTYFNNVGSDAWAGLSTTEKEQALRKATLYISGEFRDRWAGVRVSATQALDWPRYLVPVRDAPGGTRYPTFYPNTTVPLGVQYACAEAAVRASAGDLAPDLTRGVLTETVGTLSVEYDPNSPELPRYHAIERMLTPYLKFSGGAGVVSLVRG